MNLQGRRITLLVTGSIAAYKSAELVRELKKNGAEVHVAMTSAAAEFITPLTLQTLSGNPVSSDLFDLQEESRIGHIRLADEADVVLLCPASADVLAKAAHGMADSVVAAVLLATKSPVVFAPAMNVNMWQNAATRKNIEILQQRGWCMVPPDEGELACGWQGEGRLAELSSILSAVQGALRPGTWKGKHVVVTAGPTRERIDPVRFISNHSSGRMGYAIARRAADRGARVTLISGPTSLEAPRGVELVQIESAREMEDAVSRSLQSLAGTGTAGEEVLIMAAAVTDFRPRLALAKKGKESKSAGHSVEMVPNTDILRVTGEKRAELPEASRRRLILVGFAAETGTDEEVLSYAREKLSAKKVDLIIANRVDEGFGGDSSRVFILSGDRVEEVSGTKDRIAGKILDAVEGYSPGKPAQKVRRAK